MNILLVSNGYPPTALGGVETYTRDVAEELARQGHTVTVFCRESDFGQPDYQVREENLGGVHVARLVNDYKGKPAFTKTIQDAAIETRFARFLEAARPDAVHFNHLLALSASLPQTARQMGYPVVVSLHDFWPLCHRINLVDWRGRPCPGPLLAGGDRDGGVCALCVAGGPRHYYLSRWVARPLRWASYRASAVFKRRLPAGEDQPRALVASPAIFVERYQAFFQSLEAAGRLLAPSEYVRQQYAANGYPAGRIEVLPLGIEVIERGDQAARGADLEGGIPEQPKDGEITVGAIGALLPIKGMDLLIRAFRQVQNPGARLHIYGRDDLFPRRHVLYLRQLAQADPRVSLLGPFPPAERARVLAGIDVLVVPSRVPETFSLAAREALALGKPVVAVRAGALPEAVVEGVNGFLFAPGNVAQLAGILQRLVAQPGSLARLVCPGPVEILTVAAHVARLVEIYAEVAS